jgi:hypothetical protein
MHTYFILGSIFSFLIGICKVLRVGALLRLWQYKRLYPKATIGEVKKFEKEIKKSYYFFRKTKNDN